MPSLEYYMIEATDQIGGDISMQDFVDAMNEILSADWPPLHDAMKTNDEAQIGHLVMRMVRREYNKRIIDTAQSNYTNHLSAMADDHAEMIRGNKRDRDEPTNQIWAGWK
jgi:hypothetical protein